jgi:hypothetical protein
LQRRDLLRAGQTGLGDGLGQVEVEHQGKEQEETGRLGGELPSIFEGQRPDVGDVGHEGTVVGVITRLPKGATLASRGQAGAAQDPEEIRFADVEALTLEGGVDVGQGGPLAAEFAGPLVDGITFRRCFAAGPGGGEERVDVGSAGKVAGDRTNGTDMEMESLGDFIGGCRLVEVSATDLVVTLSREVRLLEHTREFWGASHRS